jgi:hypothetical protein
MVWPDFGFRSQPTNQALSAEAITYFEQVAAEYQLVLPGPQSPSADAARKIGDAIVSKAPEQRTCADLFELEICVVRLQPEAELRRRAWALRSKYRDLAGKEEYDAYLASNPPNPNDAPIDILRADIEQVLSEFHWIYAFRPVRDQVRDALGRVVFLFTLTLVLIACGIAAYGWRDASAIDHQNSNSTKSGDGIPVLPIVIAMGMIGGYVSLQRRIQAVPSTGDPIVSLAELSNSRFSIFLAPISGAVFASVLYLIFIGGLVKGPLFPTVSTAPGSCEDLSRNDNSGAQTNSALAPAQTVPSNSTNEVEKQSSDNQKPAEKAPPCAKTLNFDEFVKHTGPASGEAFAVLLVWSFIAGFAERFVPDTLDRLIAESSSK